MKLSDAVEARAQLKAVGIGAIHAVPVAQIDATDRLRPVDPAKVQLIADGILAWRAMGNDGIPAPITVRAQGTGWKLVAGAHRLAAVQLLGDVDIDAIIREMTDLQARLAEIDENLCRNELNALDRAAFLAERDSVWREMYPEKNGRKAGAKARWHSAADLPKNYASEKFSLASEISDKIGLSQRAIQADVKLYRLLASTPEAIQRLRGTWIEDHQTQLKAFAAVPAAEREAVLDRMLRDEEPAKSVSVALAEMRGRAEPAANPDEKDFAALVTLFARASTKVQNRFLAHLDETDVLDAYVSGSD